jgi:predicted RecB family nuclease
VIEISKDDAEFARSATLSAIGTKAPIIYQAALTDQEFAGFADFLILDGAGRYQVWDTKLARSPKPHYAIQLCCYSEMLAATMGETLPERFGIILGTKNQIEFRVEDFIHYCRRIRGSFLSMQHNFTGDLADRPEPLPMADHGRWTSFAEELFDNSDHLVRVAGITVGQIKKLRSAGIATMETLGDASGRTVPKLAANTLEKLVAQARLQCQTRADRLKRQDAPARFEILPQAGANGESVGLAALPPDHPADVYFDIEGYPLFPGGLEYLLGSVFSMNRRAH